MILLQTDLLPGLQPSAVPDTSKAASDLAELRSLSFNDLVDRLAQDLVKFAINLAIAIAVFYIGRFVIRKLYRLLSAIFIRRAVDPSLATFILSLVNIVLYFILIVTVIGILGIETTSFLAIFASAGVALGMALSGTLQNFAGGVLILLLKPYKIGDYIEAQGYAGTVREIQIFSTIITTYDNKAISIPNGGLSTGSVNNWSREEYRRVAWTVAISYGDKLEPVREAILKMFASDARIEPLVTAQALDAAEKEAAEDQAKERAATPCDPAQPDCQDKASWWRRLLYRLHIHRTKAQKVLSKLDITAEADIKKALTQVNRSPSVVLNEMADSSVNLQVRAWTKTENYWPVFYEYNERFYNELPGVGVHFPFPQMDVHLNPTQS